MQMILIVEIFPLSYTLPYSYKEYWGFAICMNSLVTLLLIDRGLQNIN
jgi:hypothetical protein